MLSISVSLLQVFSISFSTFVNVTMMWGGVLKVFLGDHHQCTCPVFRKEKDLCKHICWVILKKFRIPRNNPSRCHTEVPFQLCSLRMGRNGKKWLHSCKNDILKSIAECFVEKFSWC